MSTENNTLRQFKSKLDRLIHSSKGKDIIIFSLFLCVAYAFWLLLTLNIEVQEDMEVNIELVDIPDSVTIINDVPEIINVSVRDKGSSLIKYTWGSNPVMKVRFKDYDNGDNRLVMGEADIDSRLRSFFGNSSRIISSKPDSINVYYTTKPGRKAKILINADLHPALQYVINGKITASSDSVTIYSISDLPLSLNTVNTVPIVRSEMKDTTYIEAKIVPINGTRIIPDRIKLCIPVEPLIAKRRTIPVVPVNTPENTGLITFPSTVEISYLVPMSMYNNDNYEMNAYANYNDISDNGIPLVLSEPPAYYHNISMTPDSVEYIIEKK